MEIAFTTTTENYCYRFLHIIFPVMLLQLRKYKRKILKWAYMFSKRLIRNTRNLKCSYRFLESLQRFSDEYYIIPAQIQNEMLI